MDEKKNLNKTKFDLLKQKGHPVFCMLNYCIVFY